MTEDGRPDPRLTAALSSYARGRSEPAAAEVLAALAGARVFLALAARATGTETSATTGLTQERGAEMALLTVLRADGARALPAFADGHRVQLWRPEARPVPVPGPQACRTALDDDAQALLLDPHGAAFVVGRAELDVLAEGRVPVPGTRLASLRTSGTLVAPSFAPEPALLEALAHALRGEPVEQARLLEGPAGAVLGVVPDSPLTEAETAALAGRVAERLGPAMPHAGLDLAVVAPDGPGVPVRLRHRRWRRR